MATSYTSLLGLALPVTGELAGTWGDVVNNSITSLLDSAVAGTTTLSTDADVTLTTTTGSTNQSRQAILLCSGARTALRTITAPAQSKMYVVINSTTGGFGVKLVGVGPTTGVTIAAGKTAVLVWNGSDFVEVAPATATTATNLAGGVAGSVPYQSAANTTTFLGIGAANYVLTSTGTAPTWTINTGTGSVVRATSPTLVTPILGTPQSGTLTSCTGLPISTGVSGLGTGIATFLGTPSSANLLAAMTDETGTGTLVFNTSPTLVTPTFTTSATFPLHIGGTGTTSTLTLRSTSGVGTTGADIIFQTGNNGSTEAMRIANSGDISIGTATPASIGGAYRTVTLNASGGSGFIMQAAGVTQGLVFADSTLGLVLSGTSGGTTPITFRTTNLERMRIDTAGNVAIATTTALARLDVSASGGSAANNVLTATFGADDTGGTARTNATAKAARLGFAHYTNAQSAAALAVLSSTSTDNEVAIGGGTGSMNAATIVRFLTAANNTTLNGTERMRISSAGDVGVGTGNPEVKLQVAGSGLFSGDNNYISADAGSGVVRLGFFKKSGAAPVIAAGSTSPIVFGHTDGASIQTPSTAVFTENMRISATGGVSIGTTTDAGAGGLITTGNVTLGDATTDTVLVNGYMGIGQAASSDRGLLVRPTALTGTIQYGVTASLTATSAATSLIAGLIADARTAAAAFTTANAVALYAGNAVKGAGSTITSQSGVYIEDQTQGGTNNFGLRSLVSSGTGKYNIYADGTAQNYFGGNVGVGAVNPGAKLDVSAAGAGTKGAEVIIRNSSARQIGNYSQLSFSPNADYAGSTVGAFIRGLDEAGIGTNPCELTFGTGSAGSPTERMRITNTGKVGIGTSAPAQLLHIASGDATALIENTAATSNATLQLKYPSRTWTLANRGSDLSGAFAIRDTTAGADRLIITSAGNVGIGSLLSDSILTVASSTPIVKIRDLATAAINVGGTFYFQGYTNGVTGLNNFAIITGAKENATAADGSGYFSVQTSNSVGSSAERMRITSAGNVGIGTPSPVNKLDIVGAAGVETSVLIQSQSSVASTYQNARLQFELVASATATRDLDWVAKQEATGTGAAMCYEYEGAEFLRVDSAGKVGIGTNAPTSKLHVYGAGNYTLYRQETTGTATTEASWVNPSGNTLIGTDGAAGYGYVGTFIAKEFRLYTNSLERMRIDSAGNVGIGTTTPSNLFTLRKDTAGFEQISVSESGGYKATFGLQYSATSTFTLKVNATSSPVRTPFQYGVGTAGNLTIDSTSDDATSFIAMRTNGAERMRIDSSGNVGIGTTTPSGGLVVARANNNGSPIFGVTDTGGANNSYLSLYSRADALLFATSKNGTGTIRPIRFAMNDFGDATTGVSLALETNGNVGIGTTTPQNFGAGFKTLQINSSGSGATGGPVLVLQDSVGVEVRLQAYNGVAVLNAVGATVPLAFNTNTTERMRITSAGNVGIGTATPVNALQVNGSFGRNAPVTKAASFTLADTENWLICNGTATITVTLPAASSWTGREVMIKNIAAFTVVSASSNVVPLAGGAAGTAILAATAGKFATLVSDGTNWIIMQGN